MKDRYGREINYMRVSVTDRCNLRCRYCMPENGIESIGHDEILRFDEILKIIKIAREKGIRNIKITGGEPLVRKGVVTLIRDIKSLSGIESVTMTTNGVLLKEALPNLIEAGLDGVNISLDTLNPERYELITGKPCLHQVREAIAECAEHPELNARINVVPIRGINEDEIITLAEIAKEQKIDVRFIEMMPIGQGRLFTGISQDDIMDKLEKKFGKGKAVNEKRGNGPAAYYEFKDFKGSIGFISALSHKFCGSCNRIRLTSEGKLKSCLQYSGGPDLKKAIRKGKSEEEIAELIEREISEKPMQHEFFSRNIYNREERTMEKIGG